MERNVILQGDVLDRLRELPDGCVQTVVTSPPYWGLRDYGVEGQIGLEPTPAAYVAHMVEVFREVKRVLRDDGTLWLNLGDSYAGAGDRRGGKGDEHGQMKKHKTPDAKIGLKPKDLVGVPWRVAFALQDDGWYLRSDIVWSKPNPMPESVTDRPTKSHEYIFLLSKRARYYYDAAAVMEQASQPVGVARLTAQHKRGVLQSLDSSTLGTNQGPAGRNKRSVWTVATEAYAESHFATFPRKLIEPCILAGSSPQACEHCGAPWARETLIDYVRHRASINRTTPREHSSYVANRGEVLNKQVTTIGWQSTCRCEHNTGAGRCIVLDPFMGSGTVGLVAKAFGRDYVGIELNPEYVAMAERRIASIPSALLAV